MTVSQEKALYEFLDTVPGPFTLDDVVGFIRKKDPKRLAKLASEAAFFINIRNIAFKLGTKRWISRRGYFEGSFFVITPTRQELQNGILIPGHRCVPFANPALLPHEYQFFWQNSKIPFTTSEGSPEDFYPYYSILGEEYAPQYVARDNPENESAYNDDPYAEPAEVSIQTVDMRNIYRKTSFIPGDRFVVQTKDWKDGVFYIEKVGKDEWPQAELDEWFQAAEEGFKNSFTLLGPGASTDEQIAFAYWYGGERMRNVPAYSLEDFFYEKTDRIETTAYGIESRFWFSGKDIPDCKGLMLNQMHPDMTAVENILYKNSIPISEYAVQAYVLDAFYRKDTNAKSLIKRIVPPCVEMEKYEYNYLAGYISRLLVECKEIYNVFQDRTFGPIRQRIGELHTAVIELAVRLQKSNIDPAWLPKHTFIILSQIQEHTSGLLEDLDTVNVDEAPSEDELDTIDNSLDSMIETYEDIKELVRETLDNFRRSQLTIVRRRGEDKETAPGRLIQINLGGTNVWRRIVLPESALLTELHTVIQTVFGWENKNVFQFSQEKWGTGEAADIAPRAEIGELIGKGISELIYEYENKWTVRILILSRAETDSKTGKGDARFFAVGTGAYGGHSAPPRCVAGEGAAPPEFIEGPLRFRRYLSALERGNETERQTAVRVLGVDFDPGSFDMEQINRKLNSVYTLKTRAGKERPQ
ncbi:MAG: plasmid pRiA4b ORF-3 family protein [Treponema sp.]|jgi:hypothetical protein|nr:plasmid pRiA4b ORF-3 family protein [Treponema sp.]